MRGFLDRLIRHNGPFIAHALREAAKQIELAAPGPARAGAMVFLTKGGTAVAEFTASDELVSATGRVAPMDAKGNPTTLDGTLAWTSSDESVATVAADTGDPLSATVTIGNPGVALIEAVSQETDNETGDPYEFRAQGTITVTPGDATVGSIEFTANA